MDDNTKLQDTIRIGSSNCFACGFNYSLVLDRKQNLFSFGNNEFGQLGIGTFDNQYSPQRVVLEGQVIAIASGGRHCMALTDTGRLFAWGANENGQLGLGTKQF